MIDINVDHYLHFSFDIWLTLLKSHPEFKIKRAQLFKDFFSVNQSLEEVNKVVRYYDVACNNINEVTGGNIDTYEIYLLILTQLGIKTKLENMEEFYQESEHLFYQYPPIELGHFDEEFFQNIKNQNKSINLLSNTGFIKGKTMRKLMKQYSFGSFVDFQIYSDEVGMSKPNPMIFEEIMKNLTHDIDRSKVLHIGDNAIADYNGAKTSGMDAFLIKK